MITFQQVGHCAQGLERTLRIARQRSYRHHSNESQFTRLADHFRELGYLIRGTTATPCCPVEADLHHDIETRLTFPGRPRRCGTLRQRLGESWAVDRFDDVGPPSHPPGLVALHTPDHVPPHRSTRTHRGHLGGLDRRVLRPILAELGESKITEKSYIGSRKSLRHRQQTHRIGRSIRRRTRRRDAFADSTEPIGEEFTSGIRARKVRFGHPVASSQIAAPNRPVVDSLR